MDLRSMPVGELYSRLVPLVLVIIEGIVVLSYPREYSIFMYVILPTVNFRI